MKRRVMKRRQGRENAIWLDAVSLLCAAAAVVIGVLSWLMPEARRFVPAVFGLAAVVNALYGLDCLTPDETHQTNRSGAMLAIVMTVIMAGLAVVTGVVFGKG